MALITDFGDHETSMFYITFIFSNIRFYFISLSLYLLSFRRIGPSLTFLSICLYCFKISHQILVGEFIKRLSAHDLTKSVEKIPILFTFCKMQYLNSTHRAATNPGCGRHPSSSSFPSLLPPFPSLSLRTFFSSLLHFSYSPC